MQNIMKYALQGGAIAFAAYIIPKQKLDVQEIAMLAASAAATLMILDQFAPGVAMGARRGVGMGIGASLAL